MTPEEKAEELLFKMDVIPDKCVLFLDKDEIFESSKRAALIAIDEMIKVAPNFYDCLNIYCSEKIARMNSYEYLIEVKQEIEKL